MKSQHQGAEGNLRTKFDMIEVARYMSVACTPKRPRVGLSVLRGTIQAKAIQIEPRAIKCTSARFAQESSATGAAHPPSPRCYLLPEQPSLSQHRCRWRPCCWWARQSRCKTHVIRATHLLYAMAACMHTMQCTTSLCARQMRTSTTCNPGAAVVYETGAPR